MDNQQPTHTNEANSLSLASVINAAIQVPGVKVNREDFLRDQFRHVTSSKMSVIIAKGPVGAGCPRDELQKLAHRIIKSRSLISGSASFIAGLPGGLTMGVTIPADVIQFYGIALRMAQELAYLYGEEDMWLDGTPDEEKITNQLILYCGVMLGASGASQSVKIMSSALAKQALKKLPQKALTKTFYYPIVKSIAKFFGAKMTKDIFAKGVSKTIPVVGGVLSGGITLATMPAMGKRLALVLDEAHYSYSEADFTQDWNDIMDFSDSTDVQDLEETDSNQADAPAAKANSGATGDLFEEINQAKQLLDAGAITDEEFTAIKSKLISKL